MYLKELEMSEKGPEMDTGATRQREGRGGRWMCCRFWGEAEDGDDGWKSEDPSEKKRSELLRLREQSTDVQNPGRGKGRQTRDNLAEIGSWGPEGRRIGSLFLGKNPYFALGLFEFEGFAL
ncbi:hypothetical protein SLEP1_g56536 [Rubroshorea leprosula]|uniref:Uncharacterized protein n=1 Tax=Rubroshorea leprosula TaxID=152421 RepID=A0AAV5MJ15_9ROSI|nr:hypothetical protein SLEP1_g56536 [Rubroshorea leprosula]